MSKIYDFLTRDQGSYLVPRLISFFLLFVLALDIFVQAFFPISDYDVAKVVWKFNTSESLVSYIMNLKFGHGMAYLTYALLGAGLNISGLKLVDFSLLITSTYFLMTLFPTKKIINAICMAITAGMVFQSSIISYLGSYGMIMYMVNIWTGCFLVWLIKENKLINVKLPTIGGFAIIFAMMLLAFVDIRASFYFFMAYSVLVILYLKDSRCKNLIIHGAISGAVLFIPIFIQFTFFPTIHKIQPAHVLPMLYSGPLEFGAIAKFVGLGLVKYQHSLVGDSKLLLLFFNALFIFGIWTSIRKKEDYVLLLILVLSFVAHIVASLFAIYPFGVVRYTTQLFPFILYFFLKGGKEILDFSPKNVKIFFWVVCFGFLISMSSSIKNEIDVHLRLVKADKIIVQKYSQKKNIKLFTDQVTEKLVGSNNVPTDGLVSTWNVVKHIPEKKEFYNSFSQVIENEEKILILIFFPIEDQYFAPLSEVLNEKNFRRVTLDSAQGQYLYEFEKVTD